MKIFLGMEVEQDNKTIEIHLDHSAHAMLTEYEPTRTVSRSLFDPHRMGLALRQQLSRHVHL
jgi:hypothetical protein